jgi:hypothetical protein
VFFFESIHYKLVRGLCFPVEGTVESDRIGLQLDVDYGLTNHSKSHFSSCQVSRFV